MRGKFCNGDRVSVWDDEKVLKTDGDGNTTLYLMLLNCTLNNG